MKASSNGFQTSYSNERPPSSQGNSDKDADLSSDPASSSFFANDHKKHNDLKQMLDSNKDSMKLEAMKRIIGMVAKGKNASELFPAVVKNVVSKNIEVKKLVYVYLTRYAEEQQDLALLSISTFQRALKDPNQLIRGSALRVLSSIRVPMIVPIMLLAIKDAVSDMSPYVRKAAAHAIPKLYSLDPEQKDCLIEVIEKLLADKTTLVAGSAIQAFEEVCPERVDLIHKNYRKLCNLLVDVEEWGQVVIINMLTRYCRLQFVNPDKEDQTGEQKAFYSDSSSNEDSEVKKNKNNHQSENSESKKFAQLEVVKSGQSGASRHFESAYSMDADHRMLLRTCRPLLNSRNAAVVMAVAQLYHHCAPKSEVATVAKALIRLLRSHKEVQYVVLTNIASMSVKQKAMFEPYLKSFYVRYNDPTHVKLLKLEILTNLGNDANISTILREFQTYVSSNDKELAAATIQSIGRCATSISEITDTCLNGLVNLLSNRNEAVVGESVIVIKKLLQMMPSEHKEIIVHMSKMVDNITVAMAKASILWLIGEYSDRVPMLAPDVLRKMAKSFVDEEDIVKLQVINLATKLSITNPKQTRLLCQYVFNLAKYDLNYDIRDRARFLRHLVLLDKKGVDEQASLFAKQVRKIFLAPKPVPLLESKFKDMDHFQLGTLSHVIGQKANDYQELPDWPLVAPDPSVRNVETSLGWLEKKKTTMKKKKDKKGTGKKVGFYSEEEDDVDGGASSSSSSGGGEDDEDGDEESSSDDDNDSSSGSSSDSDSSSSSSASSSSSSSTHDDLMNGKETKKNGGEEIKKKKVVKKSVKDGADNDDESEDDDSSSSEAESDDDSSDEEGKNKSKVVSKQTQQEKRANKMEDLKPSHQLLLDLDDFEISNAPMKPTTLLTPSSFPALNTTLSPTAPIKPNYSNVVGSTLGPRVPRELLNRMAGGGLSVCYTFSRTLPIFQPAMLSIDLVINNLSEAVMEGIRVENKKLGPGMKMQEFAEIGKLAAGSQVSVVLLVDFRDTTTAACFDLRCNNHRHQLSISPPVGEIIRPYTISEKEFLSLQGKLGGMNENSCILKDLDTSEPQRLCNRVFEAANVLLVPCSNSDNYLFAGKTAAFNTDVLISIMVLPAGGGLKVRVNCEKILIGSMLIKELKESLSGKE